MVGGGLLSAWKGLKRMALVNSSATNCRASTPDLSQTALSSRRRQVSLNWLEPSEEADRAHLVQTTTAHPCSAAGACYKDSSTVSKLWKHSTVIAIPKQSPARCSHRVKATSPGQWSSSQVNSNFQAYFWIKQKRSSQTPGAPQY